MPASRRILLALTLALLFHALYSGWHWRVELRTGRGLASVSPTSSIWQRSSLRSIITERMQTWIQAKAGGRPALAYLWSTPLIHTIPTIAPAALVAIVAFAAFTRRYGPADPGDPESRCRRCRHILRGLQAPRCPECGEVI